MFNLILNVLKVRFVHLSFVFVSLFSQLTQPQKIYSIENKYVWIFYFIHDYLTLPPLRLPLSVTDSQMLNEMFDIFFIQKKRNNSLMIKGKLKKKHENNFRGKSKYSHTHENNFRRTTAAK